MVTDIEWAISAPASSECFRTQPINSQEINRQHALVGFSNRLHANMPRENDGFSAKLFIDAAVAFVHRNGCLGNWGPCFGSVFHTS